MADIQTQIGLGYQKYRCYSQRKQKGSENHFFITYHKN